MGHEDERDADLALDALELDLHLLAQLEVQGAERLVEQQHLGPVDEGPGEGDALPLPAGQLGRLAGAVLARAGRSSSAGCGLLAALGLADALDPQAVLDVLLDASCAGTARSPGRRC